MFRGLIEAFVGEVDSRQPNSARTNARLISRVARGTAEEMGLSSVDVETAELAGELMNLGTVSLSQDLLSKGGNRNEEEKKKYREAILRSADLVAGLEFEGQWRMSSDRLKNVSMARVGQSSCAEMQFCQPRRWSLWLRG